MHLPTNTGTVARLLGVTEPQLNDLIRRKRIPAPMPIVSGRRQWAPGDIEAAAEKLGIKLPTDWHADESDRQPDRFGFDSSEANR